MIKLNTKVCRLMFSERDLEINIENASKVFILIDEHPTFLRYHRHTFPRLMVVGNTVVRNIPTSEGILLSEESLLQHNLI